MTDLAPFSLPGRFLRGNLHTHTTNSDGKRPLAEVVAAYRDAGYDFLAITDHFLEAYGFPVTDASAFRTDSFTPIPSAELHAPRTQVSDLWHIVAVGLPLDFAPTTDAEDGPALARRARAAGAFISLAHPSWYALSLDDAETVDAAHALEIYNHGCQVMHDKGDSGSVLDGLIDRGLRRWAVAVDDAHFKGRDFGGAWVQVKAEANDPDAIVAALKAGAFYSSQGPAVDNVAVHADSIEVTCSPAVRALAVGEGYLCSLAEAPDGQRTRFTLPREGLKASPWFRLVITDLHGQRAWTNPTWFADLPA